MEQEAGLAAGAEVRITFVPHLLPTTRGIVTSVFVRPRSPLSAAAAREVLAGAYAGERFVRVLPAGEAPSLASVRGSNFCDVAAFADERNGSLVLLSSLDNLVKGASGQAVQCANLMSGFPEEAGLLELAAVP
jgi:N-acetyl-gamma-glutamyl-phosphate reductase